MLSMSLQKFRLLLSGLTVSLVSLYCAESTADQPPADPDFRVQGEYTGTLSVDGMSQQWGVQVMALAEGKFHAVGYRGGLPGDGWDETERRQAEGKTDGKHTVFRADNFSLEIDEAGRMNVLDSDRQTLGQLRKVVRQSPISGAKPPADALVLFDGTSPDAFIGGRMTDEGWLMEGAESKRQFGSFHLHLEFRLPFMPAARHQDRGNSGCYCQGRYEVQILDSFALEGHDNECGGIYHVAPPRINMCYPPRAWQTYDIDFVAAQYQGERKIKDARITVKHNGVLIHRDQPLPHATRASRLPDGPGPGPLFLQDHGSPVRFRNIWIQENSHLSP